MKSSRWRTLMAMVAMFLALEAFALPVSAAGASDSVTASQSPVDTSAMDQYERGKLQENVQAGWRLVSYSKTKLIFGHDQNGSEALIREEVLAGPSKGQVIQEPCSNCVTPLTGQSALSLSVATYAQTSSYPVDYLFQGYMNWDDAPDTSHNGYDDYVSLAWAGNLAMYYDGLNAYYDDGNSVPWYLDDVFPNQGVVVGFDEWEGYSGFRHIDHGWFSASARQTVYQGLLGNVVFKYHHTYASVSTSFSFTAGALPSISFGSGTGKWEKLNYTSFTY